MIYNPSKFTFTRSCTVYTVKHHASKVTLYYRHVLAQWEMKVETCVVEVVEHEIATVEKKSIQHTHIIITKHLPWSAFFWTAHQTTAPLFVNKIILTTNYRAVVILWSWLPTQYYVCMSHYVCTLSQQSLHSTSETIMLWLEYLGTQSFCLSYNYKVAHISHEKLCRTHRTQCAPLSRQTLQNGCYETKQILLCCYTYWRSVLGDRKAIVFHSQVATILECNLTCEIILSLPVK